MKVSLPLSLGNSTGIGEKKKRADREKRQKLVYIPFWGGFWELGR